MARARKPADVEACGKRRSARRRRKQKGAAAGLRDAEEGALEGAEARGRFSEGGGVDFPENYDEVVQLMSRVRALNKEAALAERPRSLAGGGARAGAISSQTSRAATCARRATGCARSN